jgi:tetratricopeptide (TPR) repeat protein
MKRLILALMVVSFFSASFAQEFSEGAQAKNDGNDAFRNKDYVEAIGYWQKYLESDEAEAQDDVNTQQLLVRSHRLAADNFLQERNFESAYDYYNKYIEIGGEEAANDGGVVYNMAISANRLGKTDKALELFQRSIELNSRPDVSMLYIANIYRSADEDEKMMAVLKEAIREYPQSNQRSRMVSMLVTPMLQEASVPFNEANELAKAAAGGSPNDYIANMSKAVKKFDEAIPLFEAVLEYDPRNETAQTYLNASRDNIKSFNDYKDSLNN